MHIGVPRETKSFEYRVGLTPASVAELTRRGHEVLIEHNAGAGVDFGDDMYRSAGARIVVDAACAFAAELVVKVKEPSVEECALVGADQVLFTYLHLATAKKQAYCLMKRGVTAIAYETVEDERGGLPLLTPMSEVAGRMSIQVGATALQKATGGRGVLLGGVSGVAPANVVVLGGGVAGTNAAQMAVGLQANVTILDTSQDRICELQNEFAGRARVLMASTDSVVDQVESADLVVGAVLIPGATTPKLVDSELLRRMQRGAVLVDVAIDQGGCFASSRPTTHDAPTFIEQGVVHYCVTNMPGAVPRTATEALNNVTLPYVANIADNGWRKALADDAGFQKGLNVAAGSIRHPAVAKALGVGCRLAA